MSRAIFLHFNIQHTLHNIKPVKISLALLPPSSCSCNCLARKARHGLSYASEQRAGERPQPKGGNTFKTESHKAEQPVGKTWRIPAILPGTEGCPVFPVFICKWNIVSTTPSSGRFEKQSSSRGKKKKRVSWLLKSNKPKCGWLSPNFESMGPSCISRTDFFEAIAHEKRSPLMSASKFSYLHDRTRHKII